MNTARVIGGCFATVFGAFWVYRAFTAERFENIGEGLNPPEEQRYVTPNVFMRIAVGALAAAFMLLGIWTLYKGFR